MEISNTRKHPSRSSNAPRLFSLLAVFCVLCFSIVTAAQKTATTMILPQIGPYNANLLTGGLGLRYAVDAVDPVLRADTPWTISTWFKPCEPATQREFLAGLGDVTKDLLILGIWFIIVYAVAVKTFKWE